MRNVTVTVSIEVKCEEHYMSPITIALAESKEGGDVEPTAIAAMVDRVTEGVRHRALVHVGYYMANLEPPDLPSLSEDAT